MLLLSTSSLALASPPAEERSAAEAIVKKQLVQPLAAKESSFSRFSRMRPMPLARRVRILDDDAQADARGDLFLRFALDTRRGYIADDKDADWQAAVETGCVYVARERVFVQRGATTYPSDMLIGKKVTPDAAACQPATVIGAR